MWNWAFSCEVIKAFVAAGSLNICTSWTFSPDGLPHKRGSAAYNRSKLCKALYLLLILPEVHARDGHEYVQHHDFIVHL